MAEILTDVSWIAVIVGTIAAFFVGWLWYSPMLFGKTWAAGNGVELGSAASMPMMAMGLQFVGLFLVAWFVGVTAVESRLLTFILAVLGFGVLQASGGLFARKPQAVVLIDFGYLIVASILMFIAQAIF
ncbi:DUF1761 domain-containing protein [Devosia rhodophyticola]|uniref:DUF1761 domain-containing protein n=1 Tax=Devosia rhodophyticola TaxID=3026423 RepID=A0ABY7YTP5_9HYPH|nr:DUF1761 domain-containing protein [Devosia rhodophyticola]WDR04483.1 DUF1761 domain-containing protein [Devosia rhodophyticola]